MDSAPSISFCLTCFIVLMWVFSFIPFVLSSVSFSLGMLSLCSTTELCLQPQRDVRVWDVLYLVRLLLFTEAEHQHRASGSSRLSRDVELVRRLGRHEHPTCTLRMPARGSWWVDGSLLRTRSESGTFETVGASRTERGIGWQRCQEPSEPASPAPSSQAVWEDTRQWVSRTLLNYQSCFGLVTRS